MRLHRVQRARTGREALDASAVVTACGNPFGSRRTPVTCGLSAPK
jgi:hypothetical protein